MLLRSPKGGRSDTSCAESEQRRGDHTYNPRQLWRRLPKRIENWSMRSLRNWRRAEDGSEGSSGFCLQRRGWAWGKGAVDYSWIARKLPLPIRSN